VLGCRATLRVATARAAEPRTAPVLAATLRPPAPAERPGRTARSRRGIARAAPRTSCSSSSRRGASRGAGIIGATKTNRSTATRSQTSGAVTRPTIWPPRRDQSGRRSRSRRRPRTRRAVVLAREIGRHRVVASFAKLGLHQMPVPADVTGAVDQDERRHRHSETSRSDVRMHRCERGTSLLLPRPTARRDRALSSDDPFTTALRR
jgi:hypothetical protein